MDHQFENQCTGSLAPFPSPEFSRFCCSVSAGTFSRLISASTTTGNGKGLNSGRVLIFAIVPTPEHTFWPMWLTQGARETRFSGLTTNHLGTANLKPGTITHLETAPVPHINSMQDCLGVEVRIRSQNSREFKGQGPGQLRTGFYKIAHVLREKLERHSIPTP